MERDLNINLRVSGRKAAAEHRQYDRRLTIVLSTADATTIVDRW